jgi:hypothetical protein
MTPEVMNILIQEVVSGLKPGFRPGFPPGFRPGFRPGFPPGLVGRVRSRRKSGLLSAVAADKSYRGCEVGSDAESEDPEGAELRFESYVLLVDAGSTLASLGGWVVCDC